MTKLNGGVAGFRKTSRPTSSKARYVETLAAERRNRIAQRADPILQTVGEVNDTIYNELAALGVRTLLFWTVVWVLLFVGAVYVQFGAVFFVASAFFSIWKFGLRERQPTEASAYSVFNPDVSAIQGSELTAKQMQRTMGIR